MQGPRVTVIPVGSADIGEFYPGVVKSNMMIFSKRPKFNFRSSCPIRQ